MKYTHKKININNANINYIEYMPDYYDHTLLFTHGNSSSANAYEKLFTKLKKRARLISLSLNGHGGSTVAPGNNCYIIDYISTLVTFISQLHLDNVIIVGHSIGGHVAIEASPLLKDKLVGLVCICSPPFNKDTINEAFTDPSNGLIFKGVLTENELIHLTSCFVDVNNISSGELEKLKFNISSTLPKARIDIGKCIMAGDYDNEVNIINNLKIPVLFIQGLNDKFIKAAYYKKHIHNTNCEIYLLDSCCHYPHLENVDEVASVINSYLDSNTYTEKYMQY